MASILSEARKGARKTRIMYRCNLSHNQLQVYLEFLLAMKLLSSVSGEGDRKTKFYQTTTKGHNFLDAYGKIEELMCAASNMMS